MTMQRFSDRRSLLKQVVASSLGLGLWRGLPGSAPLVLGQDSTGRKQVPLRRFSRMTQEWLVDRVREVEQTARDRRSAVRTLSDARAYQEECREKIGSVFGPLPEKTPLNARTMRVVERDSYRIENVVFESRPNFLVTANLYIPRGRDAKYPAVLGTCGHSLNGKAAEAYQSFAQGLARQGYIVLIYDPIGQGERFQYLTPDLKSRLKGGVGEHIQMGNQQTLVGEFLGTWFAWDGIRALDYLLSRPEVDPNHIALTGNSGGGTQAAWLCATESRWTMAAPACFVTTFRRNVENELPADTEQCPPRILAVGLDHCDLFALHAPKPLILLSQERDYFDVRGTLEAYEQLKMIYTAMGKPENMQMFVGPSYHGYSQENREAMYQFFNKHAGLDLPPGEPQLVLEKDETLWCTPRGSVVDLGSRTVFSFTQELARSQASHRKKPSKGQLPQLIREVLAIPEHWAGDDIDYRILRGVGNRQYPSKHYCTYAVQTEPRNHAIVTMLASESWTSRPPSNRKDAVLYLAHRSSDQELRSEPLIGELISAEPHSKLFACDVRGIGESLPDTCGWNSFDDPYGSDYFQAAHGLMLGRPYLGQRVFDAVQVVQWLAAAGFESVHLAGRGWGALVACFAAVLCEPVRKVTLKNCLDSFQSICETADYAWPYAALPDGILKRMDLADCFQALEAKSLRLIEPWTATSGMQK